MVSIVNKDKTYTIHYSIKDRHGTILEKSADETPLTFTPGDGSVLAVIEQAVVNAGDIRKINLTVLPKDAFGEFDPFLIFQVKRRAFQSNEPLKLQQSIYSNTPKGKCLVRITKLTKDTVTINGNHQLAGKTLNIDITIIK